MLVPRGLGGKTNFIYIVNWSPSWATLAPLSPKIAWSGRWWLSGQTHLSHMSGDLSYLSNTQVGVQGERRLSKVVLTSTPVPWHLPGTTR